MTRSPGTLLAGLLAIALAAPAAAPAATGGAAPTAGSPAPAPSGGVRAGDRSVRPRRPRRPVLTQFKLTGPRFYDPGRGVRIVFEIQGRPRTVRVRLVVRRPGGPAPLRTIDLGDRPTGKAQSARVTGSLPEGSLEIGITAPRLRERAQVSSVARVEVRGHRFPLIGPFTYGGEGSRFGADRGDHVHQGQDLAAAEGTPIVAPRSGVVEHVAYQAASAGHYAVLAGDGEDRHYVFMHMQTGSVAVRQGQRVRIGQPIGRVGNTGHSTGPHLHFEIWVGGWYRGGHPIDPLPDLRRWDSWS
jgi:murein DD-endopeptidase MepM/ murein hydrolase activator NlpD